MILIYTCMWDFKVLNLMCLYVIFQNIITVCYTRAYDILKEKY